MARAVLSAALLLSAVTATAVDVDSDGYVSFLDTGRERLLRRSGARGAAGRLGAVARPPHGGAAGTSARASLKARHPYYHSSAEIRQEAQRLAAGCGGKLDFRTVQDSEVDIDVVRVRDSTATPTNRVFFMFGEHPRELISPESGLRLLKVLCGERDSGGHDVSQILKHSEFEMVLNGNPRSRLKVEDGDFCLRANPDGVDLNRNWDEKWHNQARTAETNPGPKPFSEPETRIFKKLVTDFKPTTFLTVHSGTRGLYMPYAYDEDAQPANRNKLDMLRILKELDSSYCECPFGAAGKEVGYDCPGTCLDWVYDKVKTPYSFAFEIYVGGDDATLKERWEEKLRTGGAALMQQGESLAHRHFGDLFRHHASDFVQTSSSVNGTGTSLLGMDDLQCFSFFNPDSKKRYDRTVQNWAVAYLALSQKVVDHMGKNATGI